MIAQANAAEEAELDDTDDEDEETDDERDNQDGGASWWDTPDEERGGLLDIQDAMEAISAHFHEHHDAIMGWSWKLFCSKWARVLDASSRQQARQIVRDARDAANRRRQRRERRKQQRQDALNALQRQLAARE